jgi:hypothetical protein
MGPMPDTLWLRLIRWRPVAAAAVMIAALVTVAGDNVIMPRPAMVLWAWERPEDLRFAGPDIGVWRRSG